MLPFGLAQTYSVVSTPLYQPGATVSLLQGCVQNTVVEIDLSGKSLYFTGLNRPIGLAHDLAGPPSAFSSECFVL